SFAAGNMRNMAAPGDRASVESSSFEPDLQDERVGRGLEQIHGAPHVALLGRNLALSAYLPCISGSVPRAYPRAFQGYHLFVLAANRLLDCLNGVLKLSLGFADSVLELFEVVEYPGQGCIGRGGRCHRRWRHAIELVGSNLLKEGFCVWSGRDIELPVECGNT